MSSEDKSTLRWISVGTMLACLLVFTYIGVVYNFVFLGRILPAVGKSWLVPFLTVAFNTLFTLAMWSYFRAHCSDPGRVPERWHSFIQNVSPHLVIAPARPEWQPGKATKCKKCDNERPERAHHCMICQHCVLRMDHHCPWIANCVGYLNHKYFLLLAIYGCLGCTVGFVSILPELVETALLPLQRGAFGGTVSVPTSAAVAVTTSLVAATSVTTTAQQLTSSTTLSTSATTTQAEITTSHTYAWLASTSAPGESAVSTTQDSFFPAVSTRRLPIDDLDAVRRLQGDDSFLAQSSSWRDLQEVDISSETPFKTLELTQDAGLLLGLAVLCGMVAFMLSMLLWSHFPLALANMTTIEENYDNMPNPFEHGSWSRNLAQIFGAFGPDWFLPVAPRKPLSDGVSFPRATDPVLSSELGFQPEDIWRLRYVAQANQQQQYEMEYANNNGLLSRFFSTFQ